MESSIDKDSNIIKLDVPNWIKKSHTGAIPKQKSMSSTRNSFLPPGVAYDKKQEEQKKAQKKFQEYGPLLRESERKPIRNDDNGHRKQNRTKIDKIAARSQPKPKPKTVSCLSDVESVCDEPINKRLGDHRRKQQEIKVPRPLKMFFDQQPPPIPTRKESLDQKSNIPDIQNYSLNSDFFDNMEESFTESEVDRYINKFDFDEICVPPTIQELDEDDEPFPAIDLDDEIMFVGVPKDIIRFAKDIPDVVLPENIFEKRDFELYITEVHSPYKFWFHLSENTEKFHNFTKRMNDFYQKVGATYKMDACNAIKGRACAALLRGNWHRSVVLRGNPDMDWLEKTHADYPMQVRVFFLDFGTIATVSVKDVRYLSDQFVYLPRQAFRGRLALIRPPEFHTHWTLEPNRDIVEYILEIVCEEKFRATLYAYETEEQISHLFIYDNSEKKLNIDVILEKHETLMKLDPDNEEWPYLDELYPTFNLIESGEYPTYAELIEADNRLDSRYRFIKVDQATYYFSEDFKRQKIKNRNVFGLKNEKQEIEEEEEVDHNETPPPSYDNAWRNEFFSEYDDVIDTPKEIKKLSEFRWPEKMHQIFNSQSWLTEDDCKRNYREHLGIQHLFEKLEVTSSFHCPQRSQLLMKLYNMGKQMEK